MKGTARRPKKTRGRPSETENRPLRNDGLVGRLGSRNGGLQHVGRLRSFGPLHNVELDILAFLKRLESLALQGGIVDEDVFATIEPDETEPFPIIEPLHRTFRLHKTPPFLNDHAQLRSRPNKPYSGTSV